MRFCPDIPVVPWCRVDGKEVTTNVCMEDALGLTPLIVGWCREGFYVGRPHSRIEPKLRCQLKQINWRRVASVQGEFSIQMGRGTVGPWYCLSYRSSYTLCHAEKV
jgi:hypothetical protein